MKRLLSGLCATAMAASMTLADLSAAFAGPVFAPQPPVQASDNLLVPVQARQSLKWRHAPSGRVVRPGTRIAPPSARYVRPSGRYVGPSGRIVRPGYYRGYRGVNYWRPGYRRYGDYWYPAAAFVAGAIIGGAMVNPQPRVITRTGSTHVNWCYNRYRSYRASDNTFQPYSGPRKQCVSPYY